MKCPQCNAWTIVAATRDGIRRTRVCANEHRFQTEEVVRTPVEKYDLQARNAEIKTDTRKPRVIAAAHGLTVGRIWKIKNKT